MDPINQKEITFSFIQFMVLFLITIILAIVCVFFDQKFSQDVNKDLKKKLKEVNSTLVFLPQIEQRIDSVKNTILSIKESSKTEFDIKKAEIQEKLLVIDLKDTTFNGRFNNSLNDLARQWLNDKQRLLDKAELEKQLNSKDGIIRVYSKKLIELGLTKDQAEMLKNTVGD
jgi:hypothetical protein